MTPLYILIGLQVADLITTVLCLNTGKAYEANAFLAKIMGAIGTLPTLLIIKGAFVGILLWAAPQMFPAVLWLACAGYCWVIYNNVTVYLHLGQR